ncbi:hypothetical protein [Methyloraptor flagellatus]|uniref:FliH/SctL family protein n=1 Tax=Methyloraptor flagellatus TaxID=3162530 RepID=A0AAU7X7P7_9HYPH
MVGIYRLDGLGFTVASGTHVVPASRFAAVEEADAIVRAAEARAAKILADAEAVHKSERERGFAEGSAEARTQVMGLLLQEVAELDRGLDAVTSDLSKVAADAVRKLIAGLAAEERIEALVRGALHQMRRERRAELRVPSAWLAHVGGRIAAITAEFPDVELVEVVEDQSLVGDHVVLETSVGRVDAHLGDRLAELEAVIRGAHARATADRLDTITAGRGHGGD